MSLTIIIPSTPHSETAIAVRMPLIKLTYQRDAIKRYRENAPPDPFSDYVLEGAYFRCRHHHLRLPRGAKNIEVAWRKGQRIYSYNKNDCYNCITPWEQRNILDVDDYSDYLSRKADFQCGHSSWIVPRRDELICLALEGKYLRYYIHSVICYHCDCMYFPRSLSLYLQCNSSGESRHPNQVSQLCVYSQCYPDPTSFRLKP